MLCCSYNYFLLIESQNHFHNNKLFFTQLAGGIIESNIIRLKQFLYFSWALLQTPWVSFEEVFILWIVLWNVLNPHILIHHNALQLVHKVIIWISFTCSVSGWRHSYQGIIETRSHFLNASMCFIEKLIDASTCTRKCTVLNKPRRSYSKKYGIKQNQ